jgi:hypothetical protein
MGSILINKSGISVPVYGDINRGGGQVGAIYNNELFTYIGQDESGDNSAIYFYSPSGWRHGYIWQNYSAFNNRAFAPVYGDPVAGDYAFPVRRRCRIFSGENVITAIYPGGYIWTDGFSVAGSSHPYRLSIVGYSKDKVTWNTVVNGWCDTDLEIGYSMATTTTVDGKW